MDKDFEGEMMLPMTDLLDLQGGGAGIMAREMIENRFAYELIDFISGIAVSPLCVKRTTRATYSRAVFAKRMRQMGLSLTNIGQLINKDHSTVTYYLKLVDDALAYPRQFIEINRLWNKVTQRYPL